MRSNTRNFMPRQAALLGVMAAVALNVPLSASANPMTFEGTVGDDKVIVEFTDDPLGGTAGIEGRFSFADDGSDIPLTFDRRAAATLVLNQEGPCKDGECADTGLIVDAVWTLEQGAGQGLVGQWRKDSNIRTIMLHPLGQRPRGAFESATAHGLAGASEAVSVSDETIGPETHPYEFAKLNIPLEVQAKAEFNGSIVSYRVDPRTKFISPRVDRLADGSSTATINEFLKQGHWKKNLAALGCRALRYRTFRGEDGGWTSDTGSLGGYDDTTVRVTYVNAGVLSFIESGSLWCGGASPTNFIKPVTVDVQRGKVISPTTLFAEWTDAGPGEKLNALVRSRARDGEGMEDSDCSLEQLGSYLTAYLVQGTGGRPEVTFGIYNLPTVIAACSRDLATMSIDEVREQLTPEGKDLLTD